MTDQEAAELVEAILGDVKVECPFCGSEHVRPPVDVRSDGTMHGTMRLQPSWKEAYCLGCNRGFFRDKPRVGGFRVGQYWTISWRDVYAVKPRRAK